MNYSGNKKFTYCWSLLCRWEIRNKTSICLIIINYLSYKGSFDNLVMFIRYFLNKKYSLCHLEYIKWIFDRFFIQILTVLSKRENRALYRKLMIQTWETINDSIFFFTCSFIPFLYFHPFPRKMFIQWLV